MTSPLIPEITSWSRSSVDDLTYKVVGAAIEVQRHFKTGLKEKVYEECMCLELQALGIPFRRQYFFNPIYKGVQLNTSSVIDLLVDDILIVELKAVSEVLPIHKAQALNYINLLNLPKALILNFHCMNVAQKGRFTVVNSIYEKNARTAIEIL